MKRVELAAQLFHTVMTSPTLLKELRSYIGVPHGCVFEFSSYKGMVMSFVNDWVDAFIGDSDQGGQKRDCPNGDGHIILPNGWCRTCQKQFEFS